MHPVLQSRDRKEDIFFYLITYGRMQNTHSVFQKKILFAYAKIIVNGLQDRGLLL